MPSSTIDDYLDTLSAELSFDVPLARRVRKEVEDHLWETIADEGEDSTNAQRQAIERFGDAKALASEYAASSVVAQLHRAGLIALVALVGVYATMKGRLLWYDRTGWGSPAPRFAPWIALDANAFMLSLVVGIVAWAYIWTRRTPTVFDARHRTQARLCVALCVATAGPLLLSVAMDAVFTGLRLSTSPTAARVTIPVLSMIAEFVLMGALWHHIHAAMKRISYASSIPRA